MASIAEINAAGQAFLNAVAAQEAANAEYSALEAGFLVTFAAEYQALADAEAARDAAFTALLAALDPARAASPEWVAAKEAVDAAGPAVDSARAAYQQILDQWDSET